MLASHAQYYTCDIMTCIFIFIFNRIIFMLWISILSLLYESLHYTILHLFILLSSSSINYVIMSTSLQSTILGIMGIKFSVKICLCLKEFNRWKEPNITNSNVIQNYKNSKQKYKKHTAKIWVRCTYFAWGSQRNFIYEAVLMTKKGLVS